MTFISSILPITVVAAVVLFAIKELLEALRRRKADDRKKAALRKLLARECERNNAAINSLRDACGHLLQANDGNPQDLRFSLNSTPSGHLRFTRRIGGAATGLSFILRPVQQELMGRLMVEVASLDAGLFELLEMAYDAVAEVQHIRTSMIDYLSEEGFKEGVGFLVSFAGYGQGVLDDTYVGVSNLYRECTGNELKTIKLR